MSPLAFTLTLLWCCLCSFVVGLHLGWKSSQDAPGDSSPSGGGDS